MTIIREIKKELNKTFTKNGDIAYSSTLNANLDFFSVSGASRKNKDLEYLFLSAYNEDINLSLKNLFYLRDIHNGLGERKSFRRCLSTLITINSSLALKLVPFIAKYGRFDDLLVYLDNDATAEYISNYLIDKLNEDASLKKEGKPYSLCAKWMPSINASSIETKKLAKKLCFLADISYKDYRILLSSLRKGMILERNMAEKDYSFEYGDLPMRAFHLHSNAFYRNDKDRYEEYKNSLLNKDNAIKTQALFPYEIIKKSHDDLLLAEAEWKAIPRSKSNKKTIVVRDGSASMAGIPLEIATSLAILFAEQLTGEFKNKFITFSSEPKLVEIKGENLASKDDYVKSFDDYTSTNIEKVYELLLNTSKKINADDYIDRVVIISDMEFNEGVNNSSTFETMKEKFLEAGIPVPEIVYWNVDSKGLHFPVCDEPNVRLVSGFSANIINSLINSDDISNPYDYMVDVLSKYSFVDSIIS